MIECYAIQDEQGRVTAYVLKETSRHPAVFSQTPQPRPVESPLVEAVCLIVGFILLAATGLLLWIMATAT